jgi:hypothetical protein
VQRINSSQTQCKNCPLISFLIAQFFWLGALFDYTFKLLIKDTNPDDKHCD